MDKLAYEQPYFTVTHTDTHDTLGRPLFSVQALLSRLLVNEQAPLVLTEWYITEWYGDGSDEDKIIGSVSADEFVSTMELEGFV